MRCLFALVTLLVSVSINAQIKDDFETNRLGWNEYSSSRSEAIITEGHMHLVSKNNDPSFTICYPAYDVSKNFELKCEVLAKVIDDEKTFGIVIDYMDDYNFSAFVVTEGMATFLQYKENVLIGKMLAPIKLKEQRKAVVGLRIKSEFNKIEFFVNGMKALEKRFLHMESNGVGFFAGGKQKVDFDNFEIIQ